MTAPLRGGPGSVATLKLPSGWPRTEPYIVWSWSQDRWWRVDGGADPTAMQASAERRMSVAAGTRNRTGAPLNPAARFVATDRDGDPERMWWATHDVVVVCNVCPWQGMEWETSGDVCPKCGHDDVNYFTPAFSEEVEQ